jgi:hypothetical protein
MSLASLNVAVMNACVMPVEKQPVSIIAHTITKNKYSQSSTERESRDPEKVLVQNLLAAFWVLSRRGGHRNHDRHLELLDVR